jgi:hypothetical protein
MKFFLKNIDSISIVMVAASWLLFMVGFFVPAMVLLGLVLIGSVTLLIQSSEL